jgi:sugar lactone lactonase YvrE
MILGEQVGCLGLTEDKHKVIVGARSGWKLVDLINSAVTDIADPERDRPACRFNDGAVDARGRFWTGSLEDSEQLPIGRLYQLDPNGSVQTADEGFLCPNGIGWSPDDTSMYLVDSRRDVVYRYQFDPDAGLIKRRDIYLDTSTMDGIPDGLCVDAEGNVWIAFWDGAHVARFGADGRPQVRIDLPVPLPTSMALGGPDLRDIFITSARRGLAPHALNAAPDSGALLVARTDVPGLPPHYFRLMEGPPQ